MIWDRIASRLIHAIGYDIGPRTMVVKFTDGSVKYHSPVPISIYQAIAHARFPEKTYRHYVKEHVLA